MAQDTVIVVIAARTGSRRYKNKVLADLGGTLMLRRVIDRAREILLPVVVTIPDRDPVLGAHLDAWGVTTIAGPEHDLVRRYLQASEGFEHVVRVTGDSPFLDPWAARCAVVQHLETGADLTIDQAEGRGVQVYRRALLEQMDSAKLTRAEREHLDLWPLGRGRGLVRLSTVKFSVDTPAELALAVRRLNL